MYERRERQLLFEERRDSALQMVRHGALQSCAERCLSAASSSKALVQPENSPAHVLSHPHTAPVRLSSALRSEAMLRMCMASRGGGMLGE